MVESDRIWGVLSSVSSARRRKATGAYYTPAPLIDLLLDHALPALLEHREEPLRILDPACGAGDFLIAAHRRTKGRAVELYGVDIDAQAVECCRAALRGEGAEDGRIHLACTDALLNPPGFLEAGRFDLVLGNPPYVNGIEGDIGEKTKAKLRERFSSIRGTADLVHYFLEQAIKLVRPGGRVAMVLPRAVLNSPAARELRTHLPGHLRPNLIYAPERCDFFPGAAVFICVVILGGEVGWDQSPVTEKERWDKSHPTGFCLFSTDFDPARARFTAGVVEGDNWWLALQRAGGAAELHNESNLLASRFEVAASMTTGDAYDVVPHLVDDGGNEGLKLVTTGLIEPGLCLWGERACRYLGKDYRRPRVKGGVGLTRSLVRRSLNAKRPKIIVAGLARQMEAFLDRAGEYIGAVSTFTIYHPQDDAGALSGLVEYLHSPQVTRHLIEHLGANGLRGRHITLKKSFLQRLPM